MSYRGMAATLGVILIMAGPPSVRAHDEDGEDAIERQQERADDQAHEHRFRNWIEHAGDKIRHGAEKVEEKLSHGATKVKEHVDPDHHPEH